MSKLWPESESEMFEKYIQSSYISLAKHRKHTPGRFFKNIFYKLFQNIDEDLIFLILFLNLTFLQISMLEPY